MNIKEMRARLGITQSEFAKRYQIPFRTIQNWESGLRQPPQYIHTLLEEKIKADLINRKTTSLPVYDARKKNLPKRSDYIGGLSWLKAVQNCLGREVVFALDEALMCQGNFGGHSDEYLVWLYGDNSVEQFNGVVVLGNQISKHHVIQEDGLTYTNFNRTLTDAFANEEFLDMDGVTEAVSKYYFSHGESFDGIFVAPQYQDRFDTLAEAAKAYYDR